MDEILRNDIISNKNMKREEHMSLQQLKETRFLTHRLFGEISENMSYEIFKFQNSTDLLQIRALNLGGYQLISNPYLRARIKNYLKGKPFPTLTGLLYDIGRSNLLFEQTNSHMLNLSNIYIILIQNRL